MGRENKEEKARLKREKKEERTREKEKDMPGARSQAAASQPDMRHGNSRKMRHTKVKKDKKS